MNCKIFNKMNELNMSNKKQHEFCDEYKIYSALHENINEGIVYIYNEKLKKISGKRNLACIIYKNEGKNRRVYCELLYADEYYINRYDIPKKNNFDGNKIFINEWFRIQLSELKMHNTYVLEINLLKGLHYILARLFFYPLKHPQIIVRTGSLLSLISIVLGIISLLPILWDIGKILIAGIISLLGLIFGGHYIFFFFYRTFAYEWDKTGMRGLSNS